MNIVDDILHDKAGDYIAAGIALAQGLMVSDRATCKAGYSDENAAYAAQTAYGLSEEDRLEVLRLVREEYRPGDIGFFTGLFDGVRYDGSPAEWYVNRWDAGGYWNAIMGPFDTETEARIAYAQKSEEWAL